MQHQMKKIRLLFAAFVATLLATSCTQYHFEDTGLANGKHEKSMWDYFGEDSYNWDSLRVMARRANLVSLFQGNSAYGKDFTFFGPTNITIMRYLQDNHLNSIADIPVNDCKTFILNGVLRKHMMLDDFKQGTKSTDVSTPIGKGGEMFTMASGLQLWVYSFREAYNNVPGTGPVQIYLVSPTTTRTSHVGSCNIETQTGVVHALDYNFNLNDF